MRVERRQGRRGLISVEGEPAGQCPLAGVAQHLTGVTVPVWYARARPHAAGVAPQHDGRRSATVEQDRGVAAQPAEEILDLVGRVAAALDRVPLSIRVLITGEAAS